MFPGKLLMLQWLDLTPHTYGKRNWSQWEGEEIEEGRGGVEEGEGGEREKEQEEEEEEEMWSWEGIGSGGDDQGELEPGD